MDGPVAIHKLAEQMGLTSRTLRHWEAEGLFESKRDQSSGWRVYDETTLRSIRMTALLRKMDISLRDIKSVIAHPSLARLSSVIADKVKELQTEGVELARFQGQLEQVQAFLQQQEVLATVDEIIKQTEVLLMSSLTESSTVKIITLPAMRVVYHLAVSASPEDEAMAPVLEWVQAANLLGTARLFGGNVKPLPSRPGKPYGYGMCATIPEGVAVPAHLKEMVLPGGLYAMLTSSDDVNASWKTLMGKLATEGLYKSDRSRLCLEEHIRNEKPTGCGHEYHLILLEPVLARDEEG